MKPLVIPNVAAAVRDMEIALNAAAAVLDREIALNVAAEVLDMAIVWWWDNYLGLGSVSDFLVAHAGTVVVVLVMDSL